jgi:hypothetical protein
MTALTQSNGGGKRLIVAFLLGGAATVLITWTVVNFVN